MIVPGTSKRGSSGAVVAASWAPMMPPGPSPCSFSGFHMTTFSLYVPGESTSRLPAVAPSMAFWRMCGLAAVHGPTLTTVGL